MMKRNTILYIVLAATFLVGCSTTSNLPEGDVLYTGIKQINVDGRKNTYAESVALTEIEGALAYAPNNSFMGSSSLRMPPPIGLWIYNSMVNKEHSALGGWLLRTFGSTPVTIAQVNPDTRTKVATNTLQNYGYFSGYVNYELLPQRNPRKQKIRYDVHLGPASILDTLHYAFGEGVQDSIVQAHLAESYLHENDQFSVPNLQAEKERISADLRNNGFYYFRPDYIRYLADTINEPGNVKLLVARDLDAPDNADRQYYIGNIHTYVRRSQSTNRMATTRRTTVADSLAVPRTPTDSLSTTRTDSLARRRTGRTIVYDDSIVRPGFRYVYQGQREPIRPRVLFKNYTFRRQQLFDQSKISRTMTNLANMQVFSNVQFSFTPRDTTATCDTIDVRIDATMDKLIDTEFEFGITQKSNAQVGPNAKATIAKRNAFGHGETLSVSLRGSYEWQTGNRRMSADGQRPDSWEAGLDATLAYPWLAFPGLADRNFTYPASTHFSVSITNLKRAGYYRLVSVGAEATYNYQTAARWKHSFTPLSLTYNRLMQTSARFDSITKSNPALYVSMRNQLIPAMQYAITYDNSADPQRRFTTRFTATVKEAGNLLNAVNMALGHDYNRKDKKLLGTPYSQFLKISTELVNNYKLTNKTQLATRLQVGAIWNYGNATYAPYSEMFYVGGVNSIRAFGVRTIGPGRYYDRTGRGTYLDQSGDFKLEANVEYRFNVVSNLYGALFLDAGNVWMLKHDETHEGGTLSDGDFFRSLALGTGFGLRYDLEFLVLRLDLGIGIHAPYETSKKGYYNIPKFGDGLGLHFAVGYPF